MAVKIRLARIGRKSVPMCRIVAIDSRRKRDGGALEILGTYNLLSGEMVQLHADRIQAWVDQGAVKSDAFKKIEKKYKDSSAALAK